MRRSFLCLLAFIAALPLWAADADSLVISCHITCAWSGGTSARDHKLTQAEIAKLPKFADVKFAEPETPKEIAAPDFFIKEIRDETDTDVITYKGSFTQAFFRDTYDRRGSPYVIVPPYAHGFTAPVPNFVPPGLTWQWSNLPSGGPGSLKSFGVVVQLYERYTQWLHAHFTGTRTTTSKSLFGNTVTQELHDADVVFHEGDRKKTGVLLDSAAFRL